MRTLFIIVQRASEIRIGFPLALSAGVERTKFGSIFVEFSEHLADERLLAKRVLRGSRNTTGRVQPGGGGRPKDVYDLTLSDLGENETFHQHWMKVPRGNGHSGSPQIVYPPDIRSSRFPRTVTQRTRSRVDQMVSFW